MKLEELKQKTKDHKQKLSKLTADPDITEEELEDLLEELYVVRMRFGFLGLVWMKNLHNQGIRTVNNK